MKVIAQAHSICTGVVDVNLDDIQMSLPVEDKAPFAMNFLFQVTLYF